MSSYKRIDPEKVTREVFEAITAGCTTFPKIRQQTRRTADRVSDALAVLLNASYIRVENRDGARRYLPALGRQRRGNPRSEPALSFSTLHDLMPHRITSATRALGSE